MKNEDITRATEKVVSASEARNLKEFGLPRSKRPRNDK